MKSIILNAVKEIDDIEKRIHEAADKALQKLKKINGRGIEVLAQFKFNEVGFHPGNPDKELNLIEQVNQTFTYLISCHAARFLFDKHGDRAPYKMNLGTRSGSDIESRDKSVVAEVFAAVDPRNNKKLEKDITRLAKTKAFKKYVFFMSPCINEPTLTRQFKMERDGVQVYAMGVKEFK